MSRTLSKILIICAMVVLFPLMIVGTAFAAYYSIDAAVAVAVYTDKTSASGDAYAHVVYNNKAQSEFEITNSHLQNIDLKAVSNGYDFKGWFVGDVEAYTIASSSGDVEFLSTDSEINVKMTDYEKLLAVFEIKNYSVRYSYKAQPTDEGTVNTTPEADDGDATVRTYYFGDTLPTLPYEGGDYKFLGWQIVGDETETIYTTASFDFNEDITLTALWQEQNKITVTYHGLTDDVVLQTAEIYENEYYRLDDTITVMEANTDKVSVVDGYNYSWQDSNGNIITEINNQTTDLDIYLREDLVSYTINVNTNGAMFNGQENLSDSFTVRDITALSEWADETKWSTDYSFHKVTGLKFGEVTYDLASEDVITNLTNAIVTANPRGTNEDISIEAIITKYFTTFTVSDSITCKTNIDSIEKDVYKYDDLPSAGIGGSPWQVLVKEGDSSITIGEILNLTTSGETSKIYAYDEDSDDGIEVTLKSVIININGENQTYIVTIDMTLNDLIEDVLEQNPEIELEDTFTITSLKALFA